MKHKKGYSWLYLQPLCWINLIIILTVEGRIMATQKCHYIIPRNVWICYFMWKKEFELRTLRLSTLIWKDYPEFRLETSVTTWVLNCGDCIPAAEAQRNWLCERSSLTTGDFEEGAQVPPGTKAAGPLMQEKVSDLSKMGLDIKLGTQVLHHQGEVKQEQCDPSWPSGVYKASFFVTVKSGKWKTKLTEKVQFKA